MIYYTVHIAQWVISSRDTDGGRTTFFINKSNNNNSLLIVVLDVCLYTRHGNNSSPTGNLEYRGNSYYEVRDTDFDLDYTIIVKELQGLSQVAVLQSVSAAC